jgi:hypothetical protein
VRRILFVSSVVAGVSACGPPDPFRIPEKTFRSEITVLCVEALTGDLPLLQFEDWPARSARLGELLAEALERGGFRVVRTDAVVAVWRRQREAHGGYYDVHTGEIDAQVYAAVRADAMADLGRTLGCGAVVRPSVRVVAADWGAGMAHWDGVRQGVGAGGWGASGWVKALSLWVNVVDLQERELYFGAGGLQVLAKLGFLGGDSPVGAEAILSDEERNRAGVAEALGPLAEPGRWRSRRRAGTRRRGGPRRRRAVGRAGGSRPQETASLT